MSVAEERKALADRGRRTSRLGDLLRRDAFARVRSAEPGWFGRQLAMEEAARSGFFLAPLGIIVGIAVFYGADLRPDPALAILAAMALAGAWVGLAARPFARALVAVSFFALVGVGLAQAELSRTNTTIFSGEATVRIEGRVVWREADDRGRQRYVIEVASTDRPVLSRPPERVRIVVSSRHEPIPAGGTYEGLVRLRPPSGPAFPGSYDFAFAPYFQGLGAYGFSLGAPEPRMDPAPGTLTVSERVANVRIAIAERIGQVLEGPKAAVATALVTGARAGIPDEINEALRITGLAHILAISGFHMALVAGFTMVSVRAAASAVPGLPLTCPTKKIAAVAALLVATGYLLISGGSVSTQRAYIMLIIMLGAVLLDRPALTLRNVAIAAIAVMVMAPHSILTASFQMSFAATAALVGAYGAIVRGWNGQQTTRRRGIVAVVLLWLGAAALSSLLAGAATAPFGVYHFQRAALLGALISNVLVMPLFTFWVMPAALIAALLMPFALERPALIVMGQGLDVVFAMAERLSVWFPDHLTGLMSQTGLILLCAALLSACFLASRFRWIALPLALAGILLAPQRQAPPELLIFEDGKQAALIDEDGRIVHLRERPNRFVDTQWQRAFPPRGSMSGEAVAAEPVHDGLQPALDGTLSPTRPASEGFSCEDEVCRAVTRSGLRIAWTEDYEKTGLLCETSDIAIVSRAIRLTECRSGANLVTLRTLRRSGSLAVSRDPSTGDATVTASIDDAPREWNIHRHADWPEFWRAPDRARAP